MGGWGNRGRRRDYGHPTVYNGRRYRSHLEARNARSLDDRGCTFEYEGKEIAYTILAVYKPDFELPNGILVETKGYFPREDRQKILRVIACNPGIDLRIVFSSPYQRISTKRATVPGARMVMTNASWCRKHGIKWAAREIPDEWLAEKPRPRAAKRRA